MFKFEFQWRIFAICWMSACISCAHQRDLSLVRDRVEKLKPLSRYASTVCEVEARPTQPALARFGQMYGEDPNSLAPEAWRFKWRQWESRCEISAAPAFSSHPVVKAQRDFLNTAFCGLNQYFFVNSPFDELNLGPDDVVRSGHDVQIRPQAAPGLGYFLDRRDFLITLRTKSRGDFVAHYREFDNEWLPDHMEHRLDDMRVEIDQPEYGERLSGRRVLKSLRLLVGKDAVHPQAELVVGNCRKL